VPTRRRAVQAVCMLACTGFLTACELKDPAAQIIPGPTVPSPVELRGQYAWDSGPELVLWTENAVSRGSFWMDEVDSNGAIAVQLPAGNSYTDLTNFVLRGPDLDPPAKAVRAIRVRYQWLPASGTNPLSLRATVESAPPNPSGYQSIANGFLKAGAGWKVADFNPILELSGHAPGTPATPAVRYLYFTRSDLGGAGLVKIDSIALVQ
jgi:hypothetical protein